MSEERKEATRTYREAAEVYLGGPTVEAAGIFWRNVQDSGPRLPEEVDLRIWATFFRWLHGLVNPRARLRGFFLLAVTREKVHALDYAGYEKLVITREIASFDRDQVWLRSSEGGDVTYLEDRKHQVEIRGEKGAAEVVAALQKKEAVGLSE